MRPAMTLLKLTQALKRRLDQTANVRFAFGYLQPTSFHSWRGDYAELALGYEELPAEQDKQITVAQLVEKCEAANGAVFTGWKGGDFQMGDRTRVWCANPRDCPPVAIVDVVELDGLCYLITDLCDY